MRVRDIPSELERYKGDNISSVLSGAKKRAFEANREGMRANYGNTVDAALCGVQILFCDETREYLYSPAFTKTDYKKGSRPELEKTVNELTRGKSSDFDRALELVRFCRDLYKKFRGRILFDGGTEEELIKKGEQLCECLSRLVVALCEIAGIAGRIVTHCGGGHLTSELYIDGKWGYFDPRTGVFFLNSEGKVASIAELLDNPSIMDDQPDFVKAEISERWTWEARAKKCREIFFSKNEVNTVKPYSLSDAEIYDYLWRNSGDEFNGGLWQTSIEYGGAQAELFGFEIDEEKPHLEFTITDSQVIDSPTAVLALPVTAVPPERVRFAIDGDVVYETPIVTPPELIHIEIKGAHRLFGECGKLDPDTLCEGVHTLYAEVIGAPEVNGCVSFEVKRKQI